MKLKKRLATLFGVAALSVATSGVVAANGTEFFDAEHDGAVLLYYFGNVRDTKGGVVDKFMVTVTAKNADLTFPFRNDTPGHFRSPDIGKAIKGSGKIVDPRFIEVTITKPGYRIVRAPKVPDKQGAVELDGWVLEQVSSAKERQRRGGAYISPPSVHSRLRPRSSPTGLPRPTFRSKISP